MSTIAYLKQVMPGQSDEWYQRIAENVAREGIALPVIDYAGGGVEQSRSEFTANVQQVNATRTKRMGQSSITQEQEAAPPERMEQSKGAAKKQEAARPNRQARKDARSIPEYCSTAQLHQAQQKRPPREPASSQLKWNLESRFQGDRSIAIRLVSRIGLDHPDKSEKWCYEKAISDLERDRR